MFSILYYSATGNTLHLANKLKEELETKNVEINNILDINPKELKKSNHLIIMYSIHAFNAPKEMIEFIKDVPEDLFDKVSIIAAGCNDIWINEGNSLGLRKILNKKGYKVCIDRVLAMPLTIGVKFSDDMNKSLIKEAEEKISIIKEDLINDVEDIKMTSSKSKIISTLAKGEKHAAKLFGLELYANKDCISCKKCEVQCPSKNIVLNENGVPKFKFNCSMCMKCIYICPKKAISPRFSKFVPLKGGYSIKDYI